MIERRALAFKLTELRFAADVIEPDSLGVDPGGLYWAAVARGIRLACSIIDDEVLSSSASVEDAEERGRL